MPDNINQPSTPQHSAATGSAGNSIREDSKMSKCTATTKKGNRCSFTAKYGDFCGIHKTTMTNEEVKVKESKLNIFLPRKEREKIFINTINEYKEGLESRGLLVNVRATNGDVRLVTTGDGRLIAIKIKFAMIERELKKGEWAVDFALPYKQQMEGDEFMGELSSLMRTSYAHRNQDESKVNVTLIRSGDVWRELEVFHTVEGPKGYKRARNLWHTSPIFGYFDHVVLLRGEDKMPAERDDNTLYVKVFDSLQVEKFDGDMLVNSDLLKRLHGDSEGCDVFDTGRISFFHNGQSIHIKADALLVHMDGPDVVVHRENIKYGEYGFKAGVEGAVFSMNPKKQYKRARTSAQFDASLGVIMHQPNREFPAYTNYEVALQEDLGYKLAETILGKNAWVSFDAEGDDDDAATSQTLEYQNAAMAICDTLGSLIGMPSLLIKSMGMAQSQLKKDPNKGGKDIRVTIPNAATVSMRSVAILEAAGMHVPTGNTISLTHWGSHISDDVLSEVLESTGGSDLDDTWTVVEVELTEGLIFQGYEFKKGEVAALCFRFPMGGRIEDGVVAVEYWLAHFADDKTTRKYRRQLNRLNRKPMLLDPEMLPPHVLELPEPQFTEPTTGTLPFMDQVAQSIAMQGTYDKVSNAFTLLVHLASMRDYRLESSFTMPFSAEFLIDVCTKTFAAEDLQAIHDLIDELNSVLLSEVRSMGEVGRAFAARSKKKNLPVRFTEEWSFDKQRTAYFMQVSEVEKVFTIFENSYMAAWGRVSPAGNLRSQSTTPSKLGTFTINEVFKVQREMGTSLTPKQYLDSFTEVATRAAKLDQAAIMELFRLQGNPKSWTEGGTNLIGHVLFNSAMLDATLSAVVNAMADGDDPISELLAQGIYDSVLERLDITVPMDQAIIRSFMRATDKHSSYVPVFGPESLDTVIDAFGGTVTVSDMETVSESLEDEAPKMLSVKELTDLMFGEV